MLTGYEKNPSQSLQLQPTMEPSNREVHVSLDKTQALEEAPTQKVEPAPLPPQKDLPGAAAVVDFDDRRLDPTQEYIYQSRQDLSISGAKLENTQELATLNNAAANTTSQLKPTQSLVDPTQATQLATCKTQTHYATGINLADVRGSLATANVVNKTNESQRPESSTQTMAHVASLTPIETTQMPTKSGIESTQKSLCVPKSKSNVKK